MTDRRYRVLGDQPYAGDDDPLGFGPIAERLEGLILNSRAATPFAIGIEASWGRGKSTLMERLRRELERPHAGVEVRTIAYNAWTAEGEDILEGLVKSVLYEMDPRVLRRALRNEKVMSWARVTLNVIAGLFRLDRLVDDAWERLSADASARNQVNDLVRKAMKDWIDQVPDVEPNRLIVVFIDDLDRCSPENVVRVFEALKLYLDAPGFVFVIGYDEAVVSQIVERGQVASQSSGRNYLEKLIPIVVRIPQPTDREAEALLNKFLLDSGTASLFDEPARRLVIDRNARNPRSMKRFINRFVLDRELDEGMDELEPELLIKILLFETYFQPFVLLMLRVRELNPIQEFLDYDRARLAVRAGAADAAQTVTVLLQSREIAPAGDAVAQLNQLESELPDVIIRLASDDEFSSLARSLNAPEQQSMILRKVQRRIAREIVELPEPTSSDPAIHETSDLSWRMLGAHDRPPWKFLGAQLKGKEVFLVEPNTKWRSPLYYDLQGRGATVTSVERYSSQRLPAIPDTVDFVIIDDREKGFSVESDLDKLQLLRRHGNDVPIFILGQNHDAATVERAASINVHMPDGRDDVISAMNAFFVWLRLHAESRDIAQATRRAEVTERSVEAHGR